MSTSDDLDAINAYMSRTQAKTPEGKRLRDSFLKWFQGLGWFDKRTDDTFSEARVRRNSFNVANSTTVAEKANVERVISTGMTREQMEAEPTVPSKAAPKAKVASNARIIIRRGSTGPTVIAWQKVLGTTASGKFDSSTETLTRAWQRKNGLKDDGVVGKDTWKVADSFATAPVVAPEVGDLTEQSKDMASIYNYMATTMPVTPSASTMRDSFLLWYKGLSWYDTHVSGNVYADARAKRNAYNLANARSPQEKAAVQHVIKHGMTTERMQQTVSNPSIAAPIENEPTPKPKGERVATTTVTRPTGKRPTGRTRPTTSVIATTDGAVTPRKRGYVAPGVGAAAGAAAGLAVGGPVGAALGAGAGFLVGRLYA